MNKFLIVAIVLIVAVGGLALLSSTNDSVGTFMQNTLGGSGNVWCDNFEWYCCQETTSTKTDSVGYAMYGVCSATNSKCVITNVQSNANPTYVYVGSQNCRFVKDISTLWINAYKCDNTVTTIVSNGVTNVEVPKGSSYWAGTGATFTVVSYSSRLAFTGASAEAVAGIPVSGSSNCVWNTALKNPSDGSAIGSPYQGTSNPLSLSYTVLVNECTLSKAGTQFLCGNIFDECTSDSDCNGYPINGNQVCTANTLMTYRCLPKGGLPSGVTQVSDGKYVGQPTIGGADSSKYSGTGKVCTVDQTLNRQVSCCPSSDVCGSNAFCDPTTYTCKQSIVCTVNSDCNQAPSCDYVNLVYKTPKCSSGQCGYSSKPVGCCVDGNCADTQTCDLPTHTCKEKTVVKDICAFSCCSGDALYIDKPCPATQFCVNHACVVEPQCSATKPCPSSQTCEVGICKAVTPETCNSSMLGLVERHIGTKEDCNFLCKIGLKSPEKINVCVTNYTPAILVGAFLLVLIGIITYGVTRKKGGHHKKGKGTNIFRTKWFWRLLIGLAVFVLLILYFKFIFWMLLGILVIFILDAIFLRGIIRKVVFW